MTAEGPLVLGIETSCDETAAAVVAGGRLVLSDVVATQHELHEAYAGVVPEIAGRAHVERILPVLERALAEADVRAGDLDAIAVGHRPGLAGSLLVGVSAAKALAWSLDRPLVGVDHVAAHLHAALLVDATGDRAAAAAAAPPEPPLPAIGLVVSGGHTTLFRLEEDGAIRRLGATIDDAVGEAFDKVAAMLDLPLPGGPSVERLAEGGDDRALDLPVARLDSGPLDYSFSGLKTAVLYAVRGRPGAPGRPGTGAPPKTDVPADAAASFQRAAIAALERGVRAALAQGDDAHPRARGLVVGGGVSANRRLRAALERVGAEHDVSVFVPPRRWCTDNAAMIAGLAAARVRRGDADPLDLPVATTSTAGAPAP